MRSHAYKAARTGAERMDRFGQGRRLVAPIRRAKDNIKQHTLIWINRPYAGGRQFSGLSMLLYIFPSRVIESQEWLERWGNRPAACG
jgi:hypothetical protein